MAVTDEAIIKIKEMITSGELKPGDRLPKEVELADRLGLSRNSLREAVKALSVIRVLDVRQGDGTYVTSLEPRLLLESMSFVVDLHTDETVLDFLEVRRVLEPAATALAARRISRPQLDQLGKILADAENATTVEELVANDLQFHRQIAEGSGNRVLCSLIDSMSGPTTRARIWRGITQQDAVARTKEQHQAIFDAIAAGEPDVAEAWARVHVAGVEHWLRKAAVGGVPGQGGGVAGQGGGVPGPGGIAGHDGSR